MDRQQIEALLEEYHAGKASDEDVALLESWYLSQGEKLPPYEGRIDYEVKKKELWAAIHKKRIHRKHYRLWPRIAAAASVIIALGSVGYFFLNHREQPTQQIATTTNDIAPGTHKAILTLANGSKVELDGSNTGTLAMQGTTTIFKNAEGVVSYDAKRDSPNATAFNSITIPKGGEYQVILPDGTHVWLNAASSLKYPTAFTGRERKVELSGEAYFEVAHNKAKPFRVVSAGQTVEVLGTHFNINAYPDESQIATTLLEGSVRIVKGSNIALLKPGQQALTAALIKVQPADTEVATAWKNGRTYFKDADIRTIMRAVGRWYDVDVKFQCEISNELFTGGISRKSNLSSLLKILKAGGIDAAITGRELIVTSIKDTH